MLSSEDLILGLCFFIEFSKYLLYIASNEMHKDIGNFLLIGFIWRIFIEKLLISTRRYASLQNKRQIMPFWILSLVNINTNLFEKDYYCICKKVQKYSWICKTRMVNILLKNFQKHFVEHEIHLKPLSYV